MLENIWSPIWFCPSLPWMPLETPAFQSWAPKLPNKSRGPSLGMEISRWRSYWVCKEHPKILRNSTLTNMRSRLLHVIYVYCMLHDSHYNMFLKVTLNPRKNVCVYIMYQAPPVHVLQKRIPPKNRKGMVSIFDVLTDDVNEVVPTAPRRLERGIEHNGRCNARSSSNVMPKPRRGCDMELLMCLPSY